MDASMWVADLGGRELWECLLQGLGDFTLLRSECWSSSQLWVPYLVPTAASQASFNCV